VKDSTLVSIVDRAGDPRQEACRRSRILAESRDMALQVAAGDQFEDEVRAAAMLTDLVERHDVRVVERSDHLGFEAQPAERLSSRPQDACPDRLEGDDAIEPLVPGLVDKSHPAAGDLVEQLELADLPFGRVVGLRSGPLLQTPCPAIHRDDRPRQPGPVFHPILVREERDQAVGQIAVALEELSAVGCRTSLEILGDNCVKPPLASGSRRTRLGGGLH
jgi:hypothetical protein